MTLTFGQTLRAQRHKLGKELKEIASTTGISQAQLGRIELGRTGKPRPDTLKLIAPAYELSWESLMFLAGYRDMAGLIKNLPLFISEAAQILNVEDWEPVRGMVEQLVQDRVSSINALRDGGA